MQLQITPYTEKQEDHNWNEKRRSADPDADMDRVLGLLNKDPNAAVTKTARAGNYKQP